MPHTALRLVLLVFFIPATTSAQFLMDMIDTTKETGQGILGVYKKFDHLRIGRICAAEHPC